MGRLIVRFTRPRDDPPLCLDVGTPSATRRCSLRAARLSFWLTAAMLVTGAVAPAQEALRDSLAGDAAAEAQRRGGNGNALYDQDG